MTIRIDQLATDTPNHWSGFASDVGLPVGRWPKRLHVEAPNGRFDYDWHSEELNGDDVVSVKYMNATGGTITLFND